MFYLRTDVGNGNRGIPNYCTGAISYCSLNAARAGTLSIAIEGKRQHRKNYEVTIRYIIFDSCCFMNSPNTGLL